MYLPSTLGVLVCCSYALEADAVHGLFAPLSNLKSLALTANNISTARVLAQLPKEITRLKIGRQPGLRCFDRELALLEVLPTLTNLQHLDIRSRYTQEHHQKLPRCLTLLCPMH
jgi:hypothetical protein